MRCPVLEGSTTLKDLLDSFTPTKYVRFYWGTLQDAPKSTATIAQAARLGFIVRTKKVKRIRIPIDVLNIPDASPVVLKRFISRPLLHLLPIETILHLNGFLRDLNETGTVHFENLKCNFDVEIGIDIHIDRTQNSVENFQLWSGDSDFEDPVEQLRILRGAQASEIGGCEAGSARHDRRFPDSFERRALTACFVREDPKYSFAAIWNQIVAADMEGFCFSLRGPTSRNVKRKIEIL